MLPDTTPTRIGPSPGSTRSKLRSAAARDASTGTDESPAEQEVSRYFERYVEQGLRKLLFPLRHPALSLGLVGALHGLPVLDLAPGPGPDGALIRRLLARPLLIRLAFQGVASVLVLPEEVRDYVAGGRRRRLREYVHTGTRLGLRFESVDSSADRVALLALADDHERTNDRASFRTADPHNEDTLPLSTWLLVRSSDGRPLLLTVAAVDQEWAVLRYSRTLTNEKESTIARYAAMPVLVERLRRAGVRFVADPGRPYWLPNSVRQYQRKVGFRLVRLHVRRGPIAGPRSVLGS